MQDRELLERAAKAAGKTLADPIDSYIPSGGLWVIGRKGMDEVWSPLANWADAFRLSVHLRQSISHWPAEDDQGPYVSVDDDFVEHYAEQGEYAATMRAITRSAASRADSADFQQHSSNMVTPDQ